MGQVFAKKADIGRGPVQRSKGRLQLQDESEDATWVTVVTEPNRKQHHHLSQFPFSGRETSLLNHKNLNKQLKRQSMASVTVSLTKAHIAVSVIRPCTCDRK